MVVECLVTPDLPSCKIYDEFSRKSDYDSLSDECTQLKDRLGNYEGIENLCSDLERNLNNICTKVNNDGFLRYRVEYLHYWLLDKAIKKIGIRDAGTYNGIISRFYYTWDSLTKTSTYREKCIPLLNIFYLLAFEDFDSTRDIYNYYYNYKYFEMNKFASINERTESCKHLSSMLPHFSKLKNLCSENSNLCSSIFTSSIDVYDPEILRKQLECNTYELKNIDQVEGSVRGEKQGILPPTYKQLEDEQSDELGTSVLYPKKSTIAISVGFSLFGVVIGFILFKLTPIGAWFHNRIIKKGKITEHFDEDENNELLNDYFITGEIKSEGKGYNISYKSLQNIE
ncbi:PIR Superfamily Protein [Plasmodium ovale wallikeri]|uniref:PIR Superfamily Protein n=2 Tax=Plasmodium ovale TaxID=36330 RepID=A0A1A8ZJ78_PLAOA|nr:PIR Superfamily Protein [Plasmodium ovale wallikeri]SBT44429.1 PIR Superfamily Protein [Plasmodium ovale wallikeri]SBT74051.1 PIR protein [Plasmodium ovale]